MKKITIEVPMEGEQYRSKAMKAAVEMEGVRLVSVTLGNNQLVVIGNRVDPVRLTATLRRKFSYANILTVEDQDDDTLLDQSDQTQIPAIQWQPSYSNPHPNPQYYIYPNVYDPSPSNCNVM